MADSSAWFASDWFSAETRLLPLGNDEFFDRVIPNRRFRFVRDARGRVTALAPTNVSYRGWEERLRRVR